jgi:zinc transporter, ZIP family
MSLYSMLPEAKDYLLKGGFDDQKAGFLLMGCFAGGFVGIQIISRLFHRFLPSHVVDCDHTHDDPTDDAPSHSHSHSHTHSLANSYTSHSHAHSRRYPSLPRVFDKHYDHDHDHEGHSHGPDTNGHATESSPLLPAVTVNGQNPRGSRASSQTVERRPSLQKITRRVASFITDRKANCDDAGPCFGYSDPCGQECFTYLSSRSNSNATLGRAPASMVTRTGTLAVNGVETVDEDEVMDGSTRSGMGTQRRTSRVRSRELSRQFAREHDHPAPDDCGSDYSGDLEAQHHHHVPENAFLSIGIQTSIAIALHKFPEGFITYATNHANPSLGFNVFLALFVHNISEGFALALPLYMALDSRWRAMVWSFILGGLSQPMGAGLAFLWFKLANHTHMTPDDVAYGCLFAATAGIMASVALQLFVEGLSLNHNRTLSILFAFLGMTLLGLSNAFTSEAH